MSRFPPPVAPGPDGGTQPFPRLVAVHYTLGEPVEECPMPTCKWGWRPPSRDPVVDGCPGEEKSSRAFRYAHEKLSNAIKNAGPALHGLCAHEEATAQGNEALLAIAEYKKCYDAWAKELCLSWANVKGVAGEWHHNHRLLTGCGNSSSMHTLADGMEVAASAIEHALAVWNDLFRAAERCGVEALNMPTSTTAVPAGNAECWRYLASCKGQAHIHYHTMQTKVATVLAVSAMTLGTRRCEQERHPKH